MSSRLFISLSSTVLLACVGSGTDIGDVAELSDAGSQSADGDPGQPDQVDSGASTPDASPGTSADAGGGSSAVSCSNYPSTDGLINVGNPLRNYEFVDKNGDSGRFCDYAEAGYQLAYVVGAALTCGICRDSVDELESFQEDYHDQGVIVIEALQDASSVAELQGWPGSDHSYERIYTIPEAQITADCTDAADCDWESRPHHFLVDLATMEVLDPWCNPWPYDDTSNWHNCVAPYL